MRAADDVSSLFTFVEAVFGFFTSFTDAGSSGHKGRNQGYEAKF